MSWTIVNRPERDGDRWSTSSYKAYLYNGPAPACKGQHADNVIAAEYQLDSGVTPNEMKLGGDNEIKVYAVRYYKRALTRREIHHNFLVDAKRYGISRWDTNNDNDTYKNEGGACEKWCEVDSDCLNTYEVCRSHSCTVVECRKNTDCENNETCNNGQCEAP